MSKPLPQDGGASHQLVEHFFRHESANLVAVLTRAFGIRRLDLIEDMVQAAMIEAMNSWRKGVPDNPAAWIHRVARNRIVDALRREQVHDRAIAFAGQSTTESDTLVDQWLHHDNIPDSLLRMIFVCCHPSLERHSQLALTLKVLCGFSLAEIARGLLISTEAAKKRVQRAKKTLADLKLDFDLPAEGNVGDRLGAVHQVLYLMFNEGYNTSHGSAPIRDDICEEAARLCHLLCEHSTIATPESNALLALMLLHAARLESRIDDNGATILLEDQNRSLWNRDLIAIGERWLAKSGGGPITRFHLEAAIAMQHCRASSVESTNWKMIDAMYKRLLEMQDSPIYRLNRAIALGQLGMIDQAFKLLDDAKDHPDLKHYALLDCAYARLHELSGDTAMAISAYKRAVGNSRAQHEVEVLQRKISALAIKNNN